MDQGSAQPFPSSLHPIDAESLTNRSQEGRSDKLWQDDYCDRYIRDEAHYRKVVHYIEANPVKAGLVKTPEQWPFSSARFRDEYRRLKLPEKP